MNDITNISYGVHCHGDTSKWLQVKPWIPQGSVLSQFLLYINDISQSIVEAFINMFSANVSLYTIDTHLKQVNDNLQNNVTNVHDCHTWLGYK